LIDPKVLVVIVFARQTGSISLDGVANFKSQPIKMHRAATQLPDAKVLTDTFVQ